jgi:hypothetical protein
MFHFPAFPPNTLCIQVRVTRHDSCRVTPFGHPGITARLTAPPGLSRPPTSFIGSWYQGIHHLPYTTSTTNPKPREPAGKPRRPPHGFGPNRRKQDARVHYAHLNQQPTTTHPHTPVHHSRRFAYQTAVNLPKNPNPTRRGVHRQNRPPHKRMLVFSGPDRVCCSRHATGHVPHPRKHRPVPHLAAVPGNLHPPGARHLPASPPHELRPPPHEAAPKLLRKEVIQPHLPVRLPCYDFVPIASPTFDHSPPHGLGHGLRVLPTFVT